MRPQRRVTAAPNSESERPCVAYLSNTERPHPVRALKRGLRQQQRTTRLHGHCDARHISEAVKIRRGLLTRHLPRRCPRRPCRHQRRSATFSNHLVGDPNPCLCGGVVTTSFENSRVVEAERRLFSPCRKGGPLLSLLHPQGLPQAGYISSAARVRSTTL